MDCVEKTQVDLGESFQTHITCKIWYRYSRERALLKFAASRRVVCLLLLAAALNPRGALEVRVVPAPAPGELCHVVLDGAAAAAPDLRSELKNELIKQ